MSFPTRLTPLLVLAAVLCRATPAAADSAVIVIGGATDKELPTVQAIAEERLELARWSEVQADLSTDQLADVIACVAGDRPGSCVSDFLDQVSADRILALRLTTEKHDGEKVRVVTGSILRRPGEVVAIEQRFCERCRDDLLREDIKTLVDSLIKSAKATLLPATLVVRSTPSGARVTVDDEVVGTTELDVGIYAGTHTLRVEKDGYEPEVRTISVGDGERVEQEFELTAKGHVDIPKPPPHHSKLAPWVVTGGGAALVVTGGILAFVVDEDRGGGDSGRDRRYLDTAPLGVGTMVAGAAVAAVGVVWLLRSDDYEPAQKAVTPTVSWNGSGAMIGAIGRF